MKSRPQNIPEDRFEFYRDNGYVKLDPGVSKKLLQMMNSDITKILLETKSKMDSSKDDKRHRETESDIHQKSAAVQEFITSDFFFEIARRLIGEDVDVRFTITLTKTAEHGAPVEWHQDWGLGKDKGHHMITCWVAITDSTLQNGCIQVYPGSHHKALHPHFVSETQPPDRGIKGIDGKGAVALEMKAGEVLVLHPQVIHGSGRNMSGEKRAAILVSYQVPKQQNNKFWANAGAKFIRNGKKLWAPLEANADEN